MEEKIKCKICDKLHNNEGTELCNRHWEVIHRMESEIDIHPEVANKMMSLFFERILSKNAGLCLELMDSFYDMILKREVKEWS